jgi:hypothetical protein
MARSILEHAALAPLALIALAAGGPLVAQAGGEPATDAPSIAQPCLAHPTIKRTKVLDGRNIVFVTRKNEIYNNQLPRQCPTLRRGSVVNYAVANSRLCAGGVFQVLQLIGPTDYMPTFICELGNFVPITEAELEDLTAMTAAGKDQRQRRRSSREVVTTEQVELPPQPAPAPAAAE